MDWQESERKRKRSALLRERKRRDADYEHNPGKALLEEIGDVLKSAGWHRDGHYNGRALSIAERLVAELSDAASDDESYWLEFCSNNLFVMRSWEQAEKDRKREQRARRKDAARQEVA